MMSVLEEKFSLHDLLEPALLKEVCQAFSQCFEFGVKVVDDKGAELLATGPECAFCRMVEGDLVPGKCAEVQRQLHHHPLESARVFQTKAFCGMRYALIPLNYQFELMGRIILGPFRDPDVTAAAIQNFITQEFKRAVTVAEIEKVALVSQDRLKPVIKLLSKMCEAFLFINAKRLITSRLHLETIYSSRETIFRQMELQSSGTPEDKEEIENLKNIF